MSTSSLRSAAYGVVLTELREERDRIDGLIKIIELANEGRIKEPVDFLLKGSGLPPLGPDPTPEIITSLQERALAPQSQESALNQQGTQTEKPDAV